MQQIIIAALATVTLGKNTMVSQKLAQLSSENGFVQPPYNPLGALDSLPDLSPMPVLCHQLCRSHLRRATTCSPLGYARQCPLLGYAHFARASPRQDERNDWD